MHNNGGINVIYVVDTNVMLNDGAALTYIENAAIVIPFIVITELDKHKNIPGEVGYHARCAIRYLESLRALGNLVDGIKTPEGNELIVHKLESNFPIADDYILETAKAIQDEVNQLGEAIEVCLLTEDLNLRLKADTYKIKSSSFEFKKNSNVLIHDQLTNRGPINWDQIGHNEFAAMNNGLWRKCSLGPKEVIEANNVFGISAKSIEQRCAFDLLLDVDLPLVCLEGMAGTGKSIVAISAALEMLLQYRLYERLVVVRPIVPVGKDIGFLPGSIDQKLEAWSQATFDIVDELLGNGSKYSLDYLVESGMLEIIPPTYIRGRSLHGSLIIVDEAQNLSKHEVKTLITRVGKKSKIVFTGDTHQVDSPVLSKSENGFTYLMDKFRNQVLCGIMRLQKTERSDLAALAAELL